MEITVAGRKLNFALQGKNTLTVSTKDGGSWELRICRSIATNGLVYLGPRLWPGPDDPFHYPARIFAGQIRRHFAEHMTIIGGDLKAFLDRFSPVEARRAA
jgi:hypothetical protein